MEKALFTITCTTCRARLVVRSPSVIGVLLDCPKCGSFVQVTPPEGWKPDPDSADAASMPSAPAAAAKQPPLAVAGDSGIGRKPKPAPPAKAPPVVVAPIAPPAISTNAASPAASSGSVTASESSSGRESLVAGSSTTVAASFSPTPDAVAPVAAPLPLQPFIEPPPVVQSAGWFHFLATHWWARWLVLGSAPLVGLAMVVGVVQVFSAHSHSDSAKVSAEPAADKPPAGQPALAEKKPLPKALPTRLDRRWLPDRTALVLSVRLSALAAQPQSEKLIGQADPLWRRSIGTVLGSLGLRLDAVKQLTWASTDLAIWPERSVVVVELAPGHDTSALAHSGEAADVGMGDFACRRMSDTAWPKPFVIIDPQTIVSGDEELLRGLARRTEARLESAPLDRLLNTFAPDADAMLFVDLAAARAAHWNLPTSRLDVWPAGKKPWRVICEVPAGLGATVHWSEPLRSELALACEGQSSAERVRAALDELIPAVKELLPRQAEALQAKPPCRPVDCGSRRSISDVAGRRPDDAGSGTLASGRRHGLAAIELGASAAGRRGGGRR